MTQLSSRGLNQTDHDHSFGQYQPHGSFLTSRAGLVLIGFLIIAGVLLFTEHRAHVLGVLVWLPLLACPLMHIFMHGRHRDGGNQADTQQKPERSPS